MKVKPYTWQEPHVEHLIECFTKYPYVIDASDTGTGKTFTSLFVAKALGKEPFVIAPKIVLTAWEQAAAAIGVGLTGVINIEKAKAKSCNVLERMPDSTVGRKKVSNWKWNLPSKTLVFWDEAQGAGGLDSQNARAMVALKRDKLPSMLLSATLANDPLRLKAAGYLLGLHGYGDFRAWAIRHGCVRNPWGAGWALMFSRSDQKAQKALMKIHGELFPALGGRLRIADIEDFPENLMLAEAYDIPNRGKIAKLYAELEEKLIDADEDDPAVVQRLRTRQAVELFKVPIFLELIEEAIDEDKSVAVFLNFRETLHTLEEHLERRDIDSIVIEGGQTRAYRDLVVDQFQTNKKHVALCMIQAAGVALSLHDLNGRPREALISPPDNATDLKQALGRIHRAGGLSKSIQKVVFAAGTVEEQVCKNVRRKLNNLSLLNDGDLATGAGF